MTKLKSPLGRVVIPTTTLDEWVALMKAMEAHEYDFRWIFSGDKPTEYNEWDDYKKETCIGLGWDKDGDNEKENEMGYDSVEYCKAYFKEHGAKFISFKKAMKLLKKEKK